MSVPTKPQTFATCAMFLADRGGRPGVETASHGSATLRTGSSGSLVIAWAPAIAAPALTASSRSSRRAFTGTSGPGALTRARAEKTSRFYRGKSDPKQY
jgi:hypothetical protein